MNTSSLVHTSGIAGSQASRGLATVRSTRRMSHIATRAGPFSMQKGAQIVTSIPDAPVTMERPVPSDLNGIPNPGAPRAYQTVDKEHPNGHGNPPKNLTVLQQHISFFDKDGDGLIFPQDTFVGFRRLGYNYIISLLAPLVINGSMSYPTSPNPNGTWLKLPDLRFPVYVSGIHKAKHGSDSEVYDTEGRFVPQKFEEIFTKFDKGNKNALTWNELQTLVQHNKNIYDFYGTTASWLEWSVTWLLANEPGNERSGGLRVMPKEAIRGQYDGSLFHHVAEQRESPGGEKSRRNKLR